MATALFTHPDCTLHEMGSGHPESPQRLKAILAAPDPERGSVVRAIVVLRYWEDLTITAVADLRRLADELDLAPLLLPWFWTKAHWYQCRPRLPAG